MLVETIHDAVLRDPQGNIVARGTMFKVQTENGSVLVPVRHGLEDQDIKEAIKLMEKK